MFLGLKKPFLSLSCYCRAKSIKNVAQVNQDMSEKALISSYQKEIKKLKRQLDER